IHEWWKTNAGQGFNSLLFGYSLGKAQRILAELAPHALQPVYIHDSIVEPTRCYREQGIRLAETVTMSGPDSALSSGTSSYSGELFLAPPSILKTDWLKKLGRFRTAFASGWMQGSSSGYQGTYDHGFVISDHADWGDLNRTIQETGAHRVFVQHREGALIRHLKNRKQGGQRIEAYSADELSPELYERIEPVNLSLL
ncbi:MAG TPA: DNA ligase-associated DEXH box helicase, partial [Bdellovibrionales bacterium]|nr:DNA ligase-associated DEXH box helicase [Bdellovibrionales bacterium]